MNGATSLHNALAEPPLDFFLMISFISAVLGNPAQTNYCAANSFLDTLALYRRKPGLAASSIALLMVLDVGVVAENADIETSFAREGTYEIDEHEMLHAFKAGMLYSHPSSDQDTATRDAQIILGLEPAYLAAAMNSSEPTDAYWSNDSPMADTRAMVDSLATSGKQDQKRGGCFLETLADKSEKKPAELAGRHAMSQCGKILMLSSDTFNMQGRSIASYGVDSMIGVELRSWRLKEFGLEIAFQTLLGPKMGFATLAQLVVDRLGIRAKT